MKVLVFISLSTHYNHLVPYIRVLKKHNYNITFLLENNRGNLDEIRIEIEKEDYSYLELKRPIYKYKFQLARIYAQYNLLFKRELKNGISYVITCDDSNRFAPLLIEVARSMKIKTVLVTFTITTKEKMAKWYSLKNKNRVRILGWLLNYILPSWHYRYESEWYKKGGYIEMGLLKIFNAYPNNPWVYFGGKSDIIFLESEFDKNYYAKNDLLLEKMKVVGNPIFDDWFKKRNDKIERKVLIWAVPPLAPDEKLYEGKGFDFFNNMKKRLLAFVGEFDVWISFHPRTPIKSKKIISSWDFVTIKVEPLMTYIYRGDLFLATVSATIRSAIILKIPTINFDIYGYHYNDFLGYQNVFNVYSWEEFDKALESTFDSNNNNNHVPTFEISCEKEVISSFKSMI